jgi:hypothetical protein
MLSAPCSPITPNPTPPHFLIQGAMWSSRRWSLGVTVACGLNTTFIAYQELISLLLRGVLVAVFVVACCKQGVNELSTECSARFQKGWALLCHCHHRLTQCVDVFSLDAECDIASSNDYVYVYLETPMNMVAYKRPTIVGFTLDIEALESSAEAYDERTFLHPEAFLYVTLDLINLSVLLCIICI